jgi:hypothetical protein
MLLVASLLVVGLLAWFAPKETDDSVDLVEPARLKGAPRQAGESGESASGGRQVTELKAQPRQIAEGSVSDLFKPTSWVVPPPPRPALVCQTLRMADADWAACQTKSWSLSSKDERIWTHSYRSQVIQVCRPAGHPNLGYRGKATGAQYVVRFQ